MEMKRSLSVCLLLSVFGVCRSAISQASVDTKPTVTTSSARSAVDETDAGAPQPLTYAQQLEAEEQQIAASQTPQQSQPATNPRDWSHVRSYYPNTYYRQKKASTASQTPCDTHIHTVANTRSLINPDDINYGGLFSIWHLHLVEDTLLSAEWWGLMCCGALVLILCLYIIWLHRQRAERYRITVDMVMQLINAHRFARSQAHKAINKYNALVKSLNADYEEEMRNSRTANAPSATSPLVSGVRSEPATVTETTRPESVVAASVDTEPDELNADSNENYAISTAQYGLNGSPVTRTMPATEDVLAAANAAAAKESVPVSSVTTAKDLAQENVMLRLQRSALEQRLNNLRRAMRRQRASTGTSTTDGLGDDYDPLEDTDDSGGAE